MKPSKISRRDFIQKSGMLLAASAIPSFLHAEEKQPTLSMKKRKNQHRQPMGRHCGGRWSSRLHGGHLGSPRRSQDAAYRGHGPVGAVMGTTGMIPAWCPFSDGEKIIYRGLAEKVFRAAKKGVPHEPADKLDWVSINPEQLMRVYDDMVSASGAKVLFFSRLADVEMASDDTIEAIIVANKNGLTAFKAKVFVDCTGDGDLSVWAGANYFMGNTEDKVQRATLCFSIANVDTYGYNTSPNLYWENKDSPIHDALKSGKISAHRPAQLQQPYRPQRGAIQCRPHRHEECHRSLAGIRGHDARPQGGRRIPAHAERLPAAGLWQRLYREDGLAAWHTRKPTHRGRLHLHPARLVGAQELRRRNRAQLLLCRRAYPRLRGQALRPGRIARHTLPHLDSEGHEKPAHRGSLHFGRRRGLGAACVSCLHRW